MRHRILMQIALALTLSGCGALYAVQQAACPTAYFTPVGWSVDGKMVYYGLDFNSHADIHAVNLDGSGDHVIIPDAFSAKLSPDRSKILATPMSRLTPNASMDIQLLATANGATWDQRSITIPGFARWSPDSQWLLSDQGFRPGPLVKINVATGESIEITERQAAQRGGDGFPVWSPDGQTIAFNRRESNRATIYLVSPDGGPVARLTNEQAPEKCPPQGDASVEDYGDTPESWMPDGKTLSITHGCGETRYVSPDGSMTDHWRSFSPHAVDFEASPDGKRVLFHILDPDTAQNGYIANVDGSDVKLLNTDMLGPIWSPDGQQVLFAHYGAVRSSS